MKNASALALWFVIALSSVSGSPPAFAEDASRDLPQSWIFLGANFGYSSLATTRAGEFNLGGTQTDVRGLYSLYYGDHTVFDLGVGWLYNRISGSQNAQSQIVRTQAAFMELGARYRLTRNIEIGPTANLDFASDMSFSIVNRNVDDLAFLGGLQFDYEINPDSPSWRMRLIARGLNTIGLSGHSLFLGQLGFQIGFPVPKGGASQVQAVRPPEAPVSAPSKKPMKFSLERELVHFETGKATLGARHRNFLAEIGKALAQHNGSWRRLSVSGNTDNRGGHKYNLELSRKRALAVKEALVSGGAAPDKIEDAGFSYDRPLDKRNNEVAWAKNRRVELNFTDVTEPEVMSKAVDAVKRKFR